MFEIYIHTNPYNEENKNIIIRSGYCHGFKFNLLIRNLEAIFIRIILDKIKYIPTCILIITMLILDILNLFLIKSVNAK
ncbi:hypothetical protein OPLHCY645_24630 [Clostridium tetani]|uniref:hypothetical protein n=1 Tax=Clostridium tetani TaxID=1513 RepID=UPI001146A494|nr:hypothetical protein [Clostridium tetani]